MTYRPKLFAGIELDRGVRSKCVQIAERLKAQGFPARFEAAEKLHITLVFLGWVDAEQVESIRNALEFVADQTAPFTLTLDKIGAFPHERRPRVVWIGARDQGATFRELTRLCRGAYSAIGFSFDKEPVAHVTIARVKDGRAHLPSVEFAPMRLRVGALTLFESIPRGGTTHYEIRERTRLRSG